MIAFLAAALLAVQVEDAIEVNYDEVKDQTTVSLNLGHLKPKDSVISNMTCRLIMVGKGRTPIGYSSPIFHFISSTEGWRYLNLQKYAVAYTSSEGSRIRLGGEFERDGEVLSGAKVIEQMFVDLGALHMEGIAMGHDLVFRLSSDDFEFNPKQMGLIVQAVKISQSPAEVAKALEAQRLRKEEEANARLKVEALRREAEAREQEAQKQQDADENNKLQAALEYEEKAKGIERQALAKSRNEAAAFKRRAYSSMISKVAKKYGLSEAELKNAWIKYVKNKEK